MEDLEVSGHNHKPIHTMAKKPKTLLPLKGMRALVSATDKRGFPQLVRLANAGVELVSTGGSAEELRDNLNTRCTDVSVVTGFPEILGGRVKIIHPNIFGGLLGDTSLQRHRAILKKHKIKPFHAVFINLYDFFGKPGIENIDVGGPSGLRAAAKNGLVVVIHVRDYKLVIDEMLRNNGVISEELRERLVQKVFEYTAKYDAAIAAWIKKRRRAKKPLFDAMYDEKLPLSVARPTQ